VYKYQCELLRVLPVILNCCNIVG